MLLGVTLFSFGQVFGSEDYLGPTILGAAVATVICIVARRLGLGTFLTLVAGAVGLALYVTVVFEVSTTLYGIPTIETARHLSQAVADAYRQSSIDFAPVPTRTGYAILMVAALWVAAAVGEIATFRWRLPLAASAGPIALFCLGIIVGTGVGSPVLVAMFLAALLTYWALESSHRIRSWGRWVTPWAHQRDSQPDSVTGGLARRMGYSCVVAALVAPFFLPAIGSGLLSWRSGESSGGGTGSGGGSGGIINPWVRLTPQAISQSADELLTVTADRATYWRLVSLDRFDSGIWTASAQDTHPLVGGAIDTGSLGAGGSTLTQHVTIEGLRGESLPAATQPSHITFISPLRGDVASDETGSVRLSAGLTPGLTYDVQSQLPDFSAAQLRKATIGNPGPQYFETPPISDQVTALTERWTAQAGTPFERLIALQAHLRKFQYSLDVPPPSSSDYLTEFLFQDRAGFCQQFATAFALQARLLGYPSRVSVGFLPGTSDPAHPTQFVVHGTDAHAWPEVYFADLGWVRFEPTPRGAEVVPRYTEGGPAPKAPKTPGGKPKATGKNVRQTEVFSLPKGPSLPGPAGPATSLDPQAAHWKQTFRAILILLGAALILFLAFVPLGKAWRSKRRYRLASGPRERASAAFLNFEDEAAELASSRRPSETAQSFAERLAERGRVSDRPATRLAQIYEAAVFGPADLGDREGAEAEELATTLRQEMWARATWWTRALRLFSPRGLWARA